MLGTVLDVFRLRQYFNVIAQTKAIATGVRDDAGLVNDARRAVMTLPFERRRQPNLHPFLRAQTMEVPDLEAAAAGVAGNRRQRCPGLGRRSRSGAGRGRHPPGNHLALFGVGPVRLPDRRRHPG